MLGQQNPYIHVPFSSCLHSSIMILCTTAWRKNTMELTEFEFEPFTVPDLLIIVKLNPTSHARTRRNFQFRLNQRTPLQPDLNPPNSEHSSNLTGAVFVLQWIQLFKTILNVRHNCHSLSLQVPTMEQLVRHPTSQFSNLHSERLHIRPTRYHS